MHGVNKIGLIGLILSGKCHKYLSFPFQKDFDLSCLHFNEFLYFLFPPAQPLNRA